MRKVIFLLLIIIVVFGVNCNVDAAIIDNSCPVGASNSNFTNSSQVCGSFTSYPGVTTNTNTIIKPDTITDQPRTVCDNLSYAVVIMVDNSYSMNYPNNKISLANSAIDSIIKAFEGSNSKFKVCTFNGCIGSGWKKVDDVANNSSALNNYHIKKNDIQTGGSTYIQNQLQRAYNKLESLDNKSPYVFIITDGYPTQVSTNGNNIGEINTNDVKALSNSSSSRYFTKTMKTLKSLKDSYNNLNTTGRGNGKLAVVALMNSNDGLVNYFLSPNPNKNDLINKNSLIPSGFQSYSEASYLKSMLDNPSAKYYETVAGVESYPDAGLYHGNVNNAGDKVTFQIPISTYAKYMNADASMCSGKDQCSFLFYFKLTNKSYIKYARLCYGNNYDDCKNNNKSIDVTSAIRQHNDLSNFYYFALDRSYTCGNEKCFKKNKIKLVIKLNDGRTFDTSSFSSQSATGIDKFYVNNTDATELARNISGDLNPTNCRVETVPVVTPGSSQTKTTKNYTSNCTSKSIKLSGNYWYYSPDVNRIFKVNSLTLNYMITENLTYNFGTMAPDKIYSGGGFKWTGTSFSNNINWQYSLIDSEVPVFSSVVLEGIYNGDSLDNRVKVNEICTNSNCTAHLAKNSFDAKITELVNGQLKSSSEMQTAIHGSFKTIDSNADSFGDSSKVPVKHIINFSGVGGYTPSYELSLRYAYSKDGSNGIIEYRTDSCEESEPNCKGQRWYVPLKYPTGEFDVDVDGNFSSLNDINFYLKATCSINAKQLLYDDPDDPDRPASGLNYRYRSISVDDPFPRGESYIPYNWKKWYSIGNNQTRLSNSLNYTPVYTVTFNRDNSNQITDEDSTYVNWSNINNDGSSKLLNSWKTSGILNSNSVQSYCEKGRFSTECDSNTGGG